MGTKSDTNPLHHDKTRSFAELNDRATDAQIPATIARDAEILPTVLAGDGPGSTLDADFLDGITSKGFALATHNHDGSYWSLTGNSGTSPGTDFLGTTDNEALELRVNNACALRLEPKGGYYGPNIVAGRHNNTVTPGVHGAAIGGGGASLTPNLVTDDFGTIGGGAGNQAGDNAGTTGDESYATVGGGIANTASASEATVGGGRGNTASGSWATVGGGQNNTASRSESRYFEASA